MLGELTNCGKNAANPTELIKRTGIAQSTSYGVNPTRPVTRPPNEGNVRVTAGSVGGDGHAAVPLKPSSQLTRIQR